MDPIIVTRAVLNSDLESRVGYMKSFLEFTADDCEIMKAIRPIAKPLVPEIVASAYNKLLSYECCKIAFFPRKDGVQGTHGAAEDLVSRDGSLTIDSASIKLRRNILEKWALKIFQFFDRVGIQHTGGARVFSTEKKKPLFVDYIHLAMTLGYITDRMTVAILTLPSSTWPLEKKTQAVRALHKISWIHNDLLARHHMEEAFQAPNPDGSSPSEALPCSDIERKRYYSNVFMAGSPAVNGFSIAPLSGNSVDGNFQAPLMQSQFSANSIMGTSVTARSSPHHSPRTPDSALSQPLFNQFNGFKQSPNSHNSGECEIGHVTKTRRKSK
ncbi:Protoglobin-domain-containing protein [Phakopsora pachyrhizi]|nr:Protoglobin-domain-containing protein [Phakopsora pachyrhizi]